MAANRWEQEREEDVVVGGGTSTEVGNPHAPQVAGRSRARVTGSGSLSD